MTYGAIIVESIGRVGLIRLNRPLARNALNASLKSEVDSALTAFDQDDTIGCVILTGSENIFSAGADWSAPTKVVQVEC